MRHLWPMDASEPGLRARKQRETRRRIAEAGFELFLAKGFEATTLDAIAEVAGISRRTFFNYFSTKEEILLAWEAELDAAAHLAVAARPASETPLEIVQAVLLQMTASFETERAIAIDRVMHATDALRARKQAGWVHKEEVLTQALAARWPDPAAHTSLRLAAMIGIAALRVSSDSWRAEGGVKEMRSYLEAAFRSLPHEVT